MRVLVTGATGFVGSALVAELLRQGYTVRAAVRQADANVPAGAECCVVGDLTVETDWQQALAGVDAVVHCAARVHVMNETAEDPLVEFRQVNVEGTLNLAGQAIDAGVKRFIYLSSIKVNGEATTHKPFSADDQPNPQDAYGISKMEAERGLLTLDKITPMEVVIIRPPLIYGAGVKGNFQALMNWLVKGWPLPLGAVSNRRSLLALDNLISFIVLCLTHPKAADQVFTLSDGEDVSTTQLLKTMAQAMNKKVCLWPVPACWLLALAKLLGKQDKAERLLGSLQVDSAKARQLLGWQPPVTMEKALRTIISTSGR